MAKYNEDANGKIVFNLNTSNTKNTSSVSTKSKVLVMLCVMILIVVSFIVGLNVNNQRDDASYSIENSYEVSSNSIATVIPTETEEKNLEYSWDFFGAVDGKPILYGENDISIFTDAGWKWDESISCYIYGKYEYGALHLYNEFDQIIGQDNKAEFNYYEISCDREVADLLNTNITWNGISFGSSIEDMKLAYGEPYSSDETNIELYSYEKGNFIETTLWFTYMGTYDDSDYIINFEAAEECGIIGAVVWMF